METTVRTLRHFALVAFIAACAGDSSTSPGQTNLAGNWAGHISVPAAGVGTLTATFLQSGNTLSGTWGTHFKDPANDNSGTLSGSVNGTQVAATLTPSVPTSCPTNVAGALAGTTITGTYAAFNCTVPASGTFAMTKE